MTEHPNTEAVWTERMLRHVGKVEVDDLDWEAAAQAGLNEREVFVLGYFRDIEAQTLDNLRTLLAMRGSLAPDMVAFLTTWNYEEFFHGRALSRLLACTGHAEVCAPAAEVRARATLKERLERVLAPLASHLLAEEFPAVLMTFGAIHELTTLRGYEQLQRRAENPVLRVLSGRIAKQERRHFAFYYRRACDNLARSPRAQRVTRFLLRHYWAPVGAGVKGETAARRLFSTLFPGPYGVALCDHVDGRVARLPGLSGLRILRAYFDPPRAPVEASGRGGAAVNSGLPRASALASRGWTSASRMSRAAAQASAVQSGAAGLR